MKQNTKKELMCFIAGVYGVLSFLAVIMGFIAGLDNKTEHVTFGKILVPAYYVGYVSTRPIPNLFTKDKTKIEKGDCYELFNSFVQIKDVSEYYASVDYAWRKDFKDETLDDLQQYGKKLDSCASFQLAEDVYRTKNLVYEAMDSIHEVKKGKSK